MLKLHRQRAVIPVVAIPREGVWESGRRSASQEAESTRGRRYAGKCIVRGSAFSGVGWRTRAMLRFSAPVEVRRIRGAVRAVRPGGHAGHGRLGERAHVDERVERTQRHGAGLHPVDHVRVEVREGLLDSLGLGSVVLLRREKEGGKGGKREVIGMFREILRDEMRR